MVDKTKLPEGCIKNKASLSKLFKRYKRAFAAIALIHHFGAAKYGYYSWYNTPYQSNSSVSDNIDAIFRHLTAHRIGKFIDPESHLPHVFHACCRAGMLITIYYREMHNSFTPLDNKLGKLDVTTQITAEELLLTTKDKLVPEYDNDAALLIHIFDILCALSDTTIEPTDMLDDTKYNQIEDLVISVWRYAMLLLDKHDISYDTEKLDMSLQCFCIENNIT